MKCLQKKYEKLEVECQNAVREFTKITMLDPALNSILAKACEPMINIFCPVSK